MIIKELHLVYIALSEKLFIHSLQAYILKGDFYELSVNKRFIFCGGMKSLVIVSILLH